MTVLRHPLARARGHGSARRGVHHWFAQRASAVLLAVLVPWAIYAFTGLAGAAHAEAVDFVARPWNATLLFLLLVALLYHAVLGLQVIIEDYVHRRAVELTLHLLARALGLIGAVFGAIQLLHMLLGR